MTTTARSRIAVFVAAAPDLDAARRAAILPIAESAVGAGGVVVDTCHRVEVIVDDIRQIDPGMQAALVDGGAVRLEGQAAVRHVIELAIGLESAVVGEDQVLHQLRTAVDVARRRAGIGLDLGLLLDAALRAGRVGRSWRPAHGRAIAISIADLAIARIDARIGALDGRRVVVVGAGQMGRAAARGAMERGARVGLASPTPDHALTVAGGIGAEPWPMDPGTALADAAAVVVALSGRWAMTEATRDALIGRPIVVDLSMPPALSADVRSGLGDRLIDIDSLAGPRAADAATAAYRSRLERLAERTIDGYEASIVARERSAVDRLADRIERQRAAELKAWLRRRPELDDQARGQLEELSRDLSARLFREPLARLARDPDGRRQRALDELFDA